MLYSVGAASYSNNGTVTAVAPSTPASGDLLIWVVGSRAALSVSTPSGWTAIYNDAGAAGSPGQAAFYKVAAGSDTIPTLAGQGSTVTSYAQVILIPSGEFDSTTPIDATGSRHADTLVTAGSGLGNRVLDATSGAEIVTAGALAIQVGIVDNDVRPPSIATDYWENAGDIMSGVSTLGNDIATTIVARQMTEAVNTGGCSIHFFDTATSADTYSARVFAVRPATALVEADLLVPTLVYQQHYPYDTGDGATTDFVAYLPNEIEDGDFAVLVITSNTLNFDPTTPTGWTLSDRVYGDTEGHAHQTAYFHKNVEATDSGAEIALTHASANTRNAQVLLFRYVDRDNVQQSTQVSTTTQDSVINVNASPSAVADNSRVFVVTGVRFAAAQSRFYAPKYWHEHDLIDITRSTGSSSGSLIGVWEKSEPVANAGTSAAASITNNQSSNSYRDHTRTYIFAPAATSQDVSGSGTAALSLAATGAASVAFTQSGTSALTLGTTSAASVAFSQSGTAALSLVATGDGSGDQGAPQNPTGSGTSALSLATSGAATHDHPGSGTESMGTLAASGAGTHARSQSGSASLELTPTGAAGTVTGSASGTAALGLTPNGGGSVAVSAGGSATPALDSSGYASIAVSSDGTAAFALATVGAGDGAPGAWGPSTSTAWSQASGMPWSATDQAYWEQHTDPETWTSTPEGGWA